MVVNNQAPYGAWTTGKYCNTMNLIAWNVRGLLAPGKLNIAKQELEKNRKTKKKQNIFPGFVGNTLARQQTLPKQQSLRLLF